MASNKNTSKTNVFNKKKTNQGRGKNSKVYNKGGGPGGSTISKKYKKTYRGQGK
jgi:hypothetical protein